MTELPPMVQAALIILVLSAAYTDLRYRKIPNWLSGAGLAAGLSLACWLRGWMGLREAALGAGLAFGVYFALFALHAMGGGDVKLMAAIGSITGPTDWFTVFLLTSILGGFFALVLVVVRGTLLRTVSNVLLVLKQLGRFRAPYEGRPELDVNNPKAVTLPHAIPIAAGCFIFLLLSDMQP